MLEKWPIWMSFFASFDFAPLISQACFKRTEEQASTSLNSILGEPKVYDIQ